MEVKDGPPSDREELIVLGRVDLVNDRSTEKVSKDKVQVVDFYARLWKVQDLIIRGHPVVEKIVCTEQGDLVMNTFAARVTVLFY